MYGAWTARRDGFAATFRQRSFSMNGKQLVMIGFAGISLTALTWSARPARMTSPTFQ